MWGKMNNIKLKNASNDDYFNYMDYFLAEDLRDVSNLQDMIGQVNDAFFSYHDTGRPVLSPDFAKKYGEIDFNENIPLNTCAPSEVIKKLLPLFSNCINWNHGGAMFNVTPPVNILGIALNVITSILNPNLAEDRSSGLLAFAEQQICRILCGLVKWDKKEISGMSCFGGKATNFYAIKNAIFNAHNKLKDNFDISKAFYITGDRGHPCQVEVAQMQGLKPENIVIIKTDQKGKMIVSDILDEINKRIQKGQIFLGVTLNAGTTMEYIVDDIEEIVELRDKVKENYSLPYSPLVHADAVLGWVWLFMEKFNEVRIHHAVSSVAKSKVLAMYEKISKLALVDSLGIDFHKLGFTAYQSSFFLTRSLSALSIENLKFGELSPYKHTIELSRGAQGVISALSALMSLGYEGYINLILNLVNATETIRETLETHPNVYILDRDSLGICSVVTLVQEKPVNERLLSDSDIISINEMNQAFVKYVHHKIEKGDADIYFSYSRSYIAPGSIVRYSGMKLYPTSPYLTGERLKSVVGEILNNVNEFLSIYIENNSTQKTKTTTQEVFHPIF